MGVAGVKGPAGESMFEFEGSVHTSGCEEACFAWFDCSATSGPRQTDCTLLRLLRARWTFSRMSEALAVQINGLGFWLWPAT